ILPWGNFPQTEHVRIVGRLITPDGRIFETDKDFKVHLVPGAPRRPEGAPDCPIPPEAITPFAVPPTRSERPTAPTTTSASLWQPVPLDNAVQLGEPIPIAPPLPGPGE